MKIIAEELNVKEIELENIKKTLNKEDIEVKIDTKITPELEAEGFAREIIRAIQAARKKAGLVKEDLINIQIGFKRENQKIIEKFVNDETKRIGAKEIIFEEKNEEKKFNYFEEGKIKENSYFIGFF